MSGRTAPELSRPLRLDRIGAESLEQVVEATPAECAALARRCAIPAIEAFRCTFSLRPGPGGTVEATGSLDAAVVRTCVVSLDDFPVRVREDFRLRFVPEGAETDDPDPDSEDEVAFAGDVIDLGEAAAEQLALCLDPYPRRDAAALPVEEAPAPAGPFAALAALRRKN